MIITLVMDQYGAVNNGTTVTTMRFAEVLKKHGHTVRVVAAAPKDQKIDDPNFYGVESYHIPVFNDFIASQGMVFAKPDDLVLREAIKGADVVHLLLPFPIQRHARLVAKDMGVAVTGAFHMQPENITYSIYLGKSKIANNALYSFFKNSFYKYINHVHCPSEMVKHDLIKHGYKNQIHAISNGVSPRFVHLDNVEKPAELKDKFVVLMIGRLSREKRQDLIIKAIGESKYNDKIQLVLCGKGPWKAHLESLSKKYLKNPVIFSFLPQDELLKVINYSDLYVHASDAESEAISCMEAFTCGLVPVISNSKQTATKQFAQDPHCLFERGDPHSLCERIEYFYEHQDIKNELSKKYIEYAKKYALEYCVTQLEKVFEKAIEENKEEIAKHGIRPISKKEARQLKKIDEKIMKLINKEEKKKHFGKITENTIKDIEENTKIDE